jgi:hypothetical protein
MISTADSGKDQIVSLGSRAALVSVPQLLQVAIYASTNVRKTLYTNETKVPWDARTRLPHGPLQQSCKACTSLWINYLSNIKQAISDLAIQLPCYGYGQV